MMQHGTEVQTEDSRVERCEWTYPVDGHVCVASTRHLEISQRGGVTDSAVAPLTPVIERN